MFRRIWVRRLLGALVALLTLALVVELAGGSYAKARAIEAASRQGFSLDVGSARIGFLSVVLKDMDGGLAGDDALKLHLPDVRVSVTLGLKVERVVVQGGSVHARGSLEHLKEAMDARRKPAASTDDGGHAISLHAEGLDIDWDDQGRHVVLTGVLASREGGTTSLHANTIVATASSVSARIDDARLSFDKEPGKARFASAAKVELVIHATASRAPLAQGPQGAPDTAAKADDAPVFPFTRLPVVRRLFDLQLGELVARLPAPSELKIDAFEVALLEREQDAAAKEAKTTFGPGPLTVSRTSAQLNVLYTSLPNAGSTPLSVALTVPLRDGTKMGDVRLHIDGGPVTGKLFGLREGIFGLTNLDRTQLEGRADLVWAEGGTSLTFDGRLAAKGVGVVQPRLSKEPILGLDVSLRARGLATAAGELRLDELEASLGSLRLQLRGNLVEEGPRLRASLAFAAPVAGCGALLESIPVALRPALRGATMSGTLGATGRIAFDTAHLDDFLLDYDVRDSCRFTAVPEALVRERYMRAFAHRVYHPDGTIGEMTTGPGTDNWTPLDRISPFMQVAVLTTEDGSFRRHRGFNHRAIRDALVANLKAKRFSRGASTITMQLAKNLFLSREKTLARKLEEIILTDYLEQTWDKDEMLELYFNVVEFGPDVYGITKAADYYFGRKPEELNLAECMFLASVLPSPLRLGKSRDKGELAPHQRSTLDTLMRIALKTGKVSPSELAEGLAAPVSFLKPGAPRPTPRPPAHGSRFEEPPTDPAWEPVGPN